MNPNFSNLAAIAGLLLVIVFVLHRLPKVDLGHSDALVRRRRLNWIVLGLAYAFLYFGRYNLSAIIGDLDKQGVLSKEQFNEIDGVGLAVYGIAFLLNGPLTNRWGGRITILLATGGSALMNLGMAWAMKDIAAAGSGPSGDHARHVLLLLNAGNMYFQSFGAVSIVKVNAHWFHVRERRRARRHVRHPDFARTLLLLRLVARALQGRRPHVDVLGAGCRPRPRVRRRGARGARAARARRASPTSTRATRRPVRPTRIRSVSFSERCSRRKAVIIMVAIEACSGFLRQAVMKQYRPYAVALDQSGGFALPELGSASLHRRHPAAESSRAPFRMSCSIRDADPSRRSSMRECCSARSAAP
jgi:OPA family glycerol-3-phosphate transporter-like MFS transporter